MSLAAVVELIEVLGAIAVLASFFFAYFTKPSFKEKVDKVLKFLPALLGLIASKVEDKEGVFDTHDGLKALERISSRIQETIQDPQNKDFEDVQEEVFEIVRDELAKYKGMSGVPDVNSPTVQAMVRVTFEGIQVAASVPRDASEDSAGNDS